MQQKVRIFHSLKDEFSGRFKKLFSYDLHNFKMDQYLDDSEIIRDFKKKCFIKLDHLKLDKDTTDTCTSEAKKLLSRANVYENTVYKQNLDSTHFSPESDLLKIALNENILKILLNYFNKRVKLFDLRLLYSENNEGLPINRDQLWHRDKFDDKSVRLWLYLTDCNIEHGPLQYLPFEISKYIYRTYFGRLDDKYLEKKKYNNNVQLLTGKAGEISLIDVRRLVHCGSRVSKGYNRIVFNAIYTGAKPWKRSSLALNLKKELLKTNLSDLQKSFLY